MDVIGGVRFRNSEEDRLVCEKFYFDMATVMRQLWENYRESVAEAPAHLRCLCVGVFRLRRSLPSRPDNGAHPTVELGELTSNRLLDG